jgi:hypothetical protein
VDERLRPTCMRHIFSAGVTRHRTRSSIVVSVFYTDVVNCSRRHDGWRNEQEQNRQATH